LWALTFDCGIVQEGFLDFFHELWNHFSELFLDLGFSDLADLADLNFWLIQDLVVFLSFLDGFLGNFGLGVLDWNVRLFFLNGADLSG
jgi:hypothetical protein